MNFIFTAAPKAEYRIKDTKLANPYFPSWKQLNKANQQETSGPGLVAILSKARKLNTVLAHSNLQCSTKGCRFETKGGDIDEFYDHIKRCMYKLVACKYCKQLIRQTRITNHEENKCRQRFHRCPHSACDSKIASCELNSHVQNCPNVALDCQNSTYGCKEKIKRKEMKNHLRVCLFVRVFCSGCKTEFFRRDIFDHQCTHAKPNHCWANQAEPRLRETYTCSNAGCDQILNWSDLQRHKHQCNYQPIRCFHCGKYLPRQDIAEHEGVCSSLICCENCGISVPG